MSIDEHERELRLERIADIKRGCTLAELEAAIEYARNIGAPDWLVTLLESYRPTTPR